MRYAAALMFCLAGLVGTPVSNAQGFLVLRELFFRGQPPASYFENLGIRTDHVVYQDELGTPSVEHLVRQAARTSVNRSYRGIVQMDHEYWANDLQYVRADSVCTSVRKMCETLRWFKSERPALKAGFYGFVPVTDVFAYMRPLDSIRWVANNDLLQPLADSVDYLCPSIYAYYADIAQYTGYATAIIREARRLARGKPIYPYISPQYHFSGTHPGQFLSYAYFAGVLRAIRDAGADGVILWGGDRAMDYPTPAWDSTWGWWIATKEFMAGLDSASRDVPEPPLVLSPAKGSLGQPTTSATRWQGSPAARQYHLQLSDNITFQQPILDDSTVTDTLYNLNKLRGSSKYYLRVRAKGNSAWTGFCVAVDFVTSPNELSVGPQQIPGETVLEQNYPNPFNGRTVVTSRLSVASHVKLAVYDLLGREVRVLVNEPRAAGSYRDAFDASGLASGVYTYRLSAGTHAQGKTMVHLK